MVCTCRDSDLPEFVINFFLLFLKAYIRTFNHLLKNKNSHLRSSINLIPRLFPLAGEGRAWVQGWSSCLGSTTCKSINVVNKLMNCISSCKISLPRTRPMCFLYLEHLQLVFTCMHLCNSLCKLSGLVYSICTFAHSSIQYESYYGFFRC